MSGHAAGDSLARRSTVGVAAARDRDGTRAVILPIGSTEAHGPHLPLATDVIIAEETASRAARLLAARGAPALVLPSLAYALTEFVGDFPGTISVSAETVGRLIMEIAASTFRQGFPVIALVNGHLEPEHARMLRRTAKAITATGAGVAVFPDQRFPPTVERLGEEFGRGGGHAGGYETSLVLAAAPDLVDEDARRALDPNFVDIAARIDDGARNAVEAGGPHAYFGDPAGASAVEGNRLYDVLASMVADAVLGALDRSSPREGKR